MKKQDKKIYVALMNRIAVAMMLNQLLILTLSALLNGFEYLLAASGADATFADVAVRTGECVVYFLSFVLPVAAFHKMGKGAPREIYEPVESGECFSIPYALFGVGVGLGVTVLAASVNYTLVNLFFDYSDFSEEFLWAIELDEPYQAVIYFCYCAIIPAVVEELLFRKTLCDSLKVYGRGTAIVVSATLFALMHANAEQIIYTFVAGLAMAWIYVETENLAFPILLHFINNGIGAVGDIIYEMGSPAAYSRFASFSELATWVFAAISLCAFLVRINKRGTVGVYKLEIKPDENGEPVLPLSVAERVSGFFSVGMIIFVLFSFFTMAYYLYLSTIV